MCGVPICERMVRPRPRSMTWLARAVTATLIAVAHNQIVSDDAMGYIVSGIEHGL